MTLSIAETDFTNEILSDLGVDITWTPVTKTTDYRGDETLTDGSASTIKAFIHIGKPNYKLNESGQFKDSDGYIMVAVANNITRDDKITHNGSIYRLANVITRGAGLNVNVYKYADLYLIQE